MARKVSTKKKPSARPDAVASEGEELFRGIFEHAAVGIAHCAPEGRFLRVNDRFCSFLGYTREELLPLKFADVTHPDHLAAGLAGMQRLFRGEISVYEEEKRYRRKDGKVVWGHLTVSLIRRPDGTPKYTIAVVQDIADRRKAEAALRENEELFRGIFEHAAVGIAHVSPDGRFLRVNQKLCDLIGCSKEDLMRRTFKEITHSDHLASSLKGVTDLLEGRIEVHAEEKRYLQDDGNTVWGNTTVSLVRNEGGLPKYLVAIVKDISDRKEVERQRKQLTAIIAASPDFIGIADARTQRPIYINLAGLATIGLPPDKEVSETRIADHHPAWAMEKLEKEGIPTAIREGLWRGESALQTSDGREIPVSQVLVAHPGPDGNPEFFSTIMRDITQEKQAEQSILKLNEDLERRVRERTAELESVNQELESFSYSVSHDLRAPLRSILGFSQALVEDAGDALPAPARSHLDRIGGAISRMGILIDDLLKLARLSRQSMNVESLDLSALARSIVDEFRKRTPGRNVEVSIAEGIQAEGDAGLIRIVLQNLLDNAWKFTRGVAPARIEFGTREEDGAVRYFVRDNGAGFDMRYADKLFTPFQRLHPGGQFEGTGIGLATVLRALRRHGGKVEGVGEIGQGATFTFTLPRQA